MWTVTRVLVLMSALSFGTLARADAVPGPPDDCIDGTRGATCHGGPHCLPIRCDDGTPCPADTQCAAVEVATRDVICSGRRPSNAPPPTPRLTVTGLCDSTPDRSHCRTLQLCLSKPALAEPVALAPVEPPPAPPTATAAPAATETSQPAPAKKGCAAAGGTWFGLGLLALIAWRWRRARFLRVLGAVMLAPLVATLGTAEPARADVVREPPPSCPVAGTRPATCHGGPYCDVVACDRCTAEQVCQTVSVCARDIQCAGDVNPEDLPKYLRPDVSGLCGADKTCAQGACRELQMCVPKGAPITPAAPPRKSGCTGGGPGPVGLAGVLAAMAILAASKRR